MYPLTIGLGIENRELWDQAQAVLADLPFRIIVEHQDLGNISEVTLSLDMGTALSSPTHSGCSRRKTCGC